MQSNAIALALILGVLLFINAAALAINTEYGGIGVSNTGGDSDTLRSAVESSTILSPFSVFQAFLSMIVWSFGLLPTWLDLMILIVLRIPAWVIFGFWIRGTS